MTNVGGANFNIRVTGGDQAEQTIRRIGEAFRAAGIAGSEGMSKVRRDLENITSTATRAQQAIRGFGQRIEFGDPSSVNRIAVGIQQAFDFLRRFKKELADIDKFAKTHDLLPDVAVRAAKLREAIKSIETQLGSLRGASKNSFNVPDLSQAERALRAFGQIQQRAIQENKKFDESLRLKNSGLPQLTQAEKAYQRYLATVSRASTENKRFDESQKLKNSGVPQLSAAERALRSYALMQAKAIAENEKFGKGLTGGIGFINRHATAINQLSFSAARAGSGFANFLPLIARSSTLFANAAANAGGMGGALTAAKAAISSAAGALGAVSLAAVAAVAAIALLTLGIGFLAVKLGPLGGAMNHLKNQISDTFGSASDEVNQFATDFGSALGISETAVLTFVGRMGQLFQAQGATAEASAEIAEGLLIAAHVFNQTTIGAGNLEQALRAVQNTIAGNIEGLREYNVLITEVDLREQARARNIEITAGALDAKLRQDLSGLEIIDQTQERLSKMSETEKSLALETQKLGSVFTDIKTAIGQAFGAALNAALKVINPFFQVLREGFQQLRSQIAESENFQASIKAMVFLFGRGLVLAVKAAGAALAIFFDVIGGVIRLLDVILKPIGAAVRAIQRVVDGIKTALRALGLLGDEESEVAKQARELAEAENELEKSARAAAEAHELTREELNKIIDTYDDLNRAIRDAERAEDDAERNLARTREDNARKIEDAQRNVQKAYRDRNRAIEDANEKLDDIERENSRSLFDAQQKLDEARLQAKRAIRNAEEKLADARIDSLKKLKDAEEKIDKARQQRQDAILNAQLSVFEAQIKGDGFALNRARLEETRARRSDELKQAEKDRDEIAKETKRDLARLERDLAEARIDAAKRVRDAEIELARAQEDAIERVSDARREQARAFEDANERIAEARRKLHEAEMEANRAEFDAEERLNRVREEGTEKIAAAIEKVQELNREFGITVALAREWLAILDAAEKNIERQAARGNVEGWRGHGASGEFAHGGFLAAGGIGLTGEKGRELVIGGSAGSHILPNDLTEALIRMAQTGGSGKTVNQNTYVYTNREDPEVIASKVSTRLVRGL